MKNFVIYISIAFAMILPMFVQAQNVGEIVSELKKTCAPDGRTAIWEVKVTKSGQMWSLDGKVDNAANKQLLLDELDKRGVRYKDNIKLLDEGWAMVKLSVASLRTGGKHPAEMATQAIMGTPIKMLEKTGEWVRVQTPDGYIAYIPSTSIVKKSEKELAAWRSSKRVIVTEKFSTLMAEPDAEADVVSDLVLGNILEYRSSAVDGAWIKAETPDGRSGYVPSNAVADFDEWVQQPFNADLIIQTAKEMLGSGYLWGGTSTKLTDCSGLTKVCYFANAIILQRDASQQALTGLRIASKDWKTKAQKGDLLFWGNKSGRVTHVGLYIANGIYIHCSGMVKYNSLDPSSELYLSTPFLSISHIDGYVGEKGITAVKDHPWYF